MANNWHKPQRLHNEDYWLYFLKDAKRWQKIPPQMHQAKWLEKAINVMQGFSERQKARILYESRVEASIYKLSMEKRYERQTENVKKAEQELAQMELEKQAAVKQVELEKQAALEQMELEKQAALEEVERLKALLEKQS